MASEDRIDGLKDKIDGLEVAGAVPAEAEEPVTAEEAAAWLLRVKPASVLALLKEPDIALPISRAFVGFRTDAKAYANPLVRGRLAQAAARDAKVAAKLRGLADAAAPTLEARPEPALTPVPFPMPPTLPAVDPLDALRAERDRRRRERDEARQAQAAAEAERDGALKARLGAEAERDAALQLSRRQAERLARLERQATRARQVEVGLLRALGEDKVSPPPSASPRSAPAAPAPARTASPWTEAVRHLLDKGKWDAALALAEDVLKADGDERDALDIAARASEGRREPRPTAVFLRRLLGVQIGRGDVAAATETLERLLRLLPHPHEADPDARRLLLALSPADARAVEAARRMMARLQGSAPAAADWLAGTVSAHTALGPVLMPPPGALAPDDALPLRLARPLTVRQALQAVGRGAEALVDAVRDALAGIAGTETWGRVWAALELDSAGEPERLAPLRRVPRGPVVVDGSNVAWFDQESLAQGKPRLRHLLSVRRALWARGFFPVVLHADANLPYFIDDKAGLLALRDRGELGLVDAGTVADEVLLRTAKLLGAPLVTNDRMEDWDPGDEVRKARYAVSANGPAYLLDDV